MADLTSVKCMKSGDTAAGTGFLVDCFSPAQCIITCWPLWYKLCCSVMGTYVCVTSRHC